MPGQLCRDGPDVLDGVRAREGLPRVPHRLEPQGPAPQVRQVDVVLDDQDPHGADSSHLRRTGVPVAVAGTLTVVS